MEKPKHLPVKEMSWLINGKVRTWTQEPLASEPMYCFSQAPKLARAGCSYLTLSVSSQRACALWILPPLWHGKPQRISTWGPPSSPSSDLRYCDIKALSSQTWQRCEWERIPFEAWISLLQIFWQTESVVLREGIASQCLCEQTS